ncbi:hypothetical protein [Oleisolibacter albus]|uniref:hypothetical protein n=1 Tax=Oleisolibacter albus TaxID=2171757 RepID=UPI000DF1A9FA|nr:hypothetical protein [Oleisolibacter albus]
MAAHPPGLHLRGVFVLVGAGLAAALTGGLYTLSTWEEAAPLLPMAGGAGQAGAGSSPEAFLPTTMPLRFQGARGATPEQDPSSRRRVCLGDQDLGTPQGPTAALREPPVRGLSSLGFSLVDCRGRLAPAWSGDPLSSFGLRIARPPGGFGP